MTRTKLLAKVLLGTAALSVAFIGFVMAQTPSHSAPNVTSHAEGALTGKVSSQAEGVMEGVLVGAKKTGSTMATWVVTNAQGQYKFPRDRMEPGKYAISVRAVGYEVPKTSIDVTAATHPVGFATHQGDKHVQAWHAGFQRGVAHECPGNPRREDGLRGLR